VTGSSDELPHVGSGPAIEVRELVKRYGRRTAVDGISFDVAEGELFALLGPNGAGKTTTVEILEGYRPPDGGHVRVLGVEPGGGAGRAMLRPRIGLMLQDPSLYPLLKPREIVSLIAAYYPRRVARERPDATADRWLAKVGFDDPVLLRTPFRRLSRGERQRVSLAAALVGDPRLVFLDEPTAGLDPAARTRTEAILRELRADGVTILLTTHDLGQAERLADRVAIIDAGRLVALGTPAGLLGGVAEGIRFAAPSGLPIVEIAERLGRPVREVSPGGYVVDGPADASIVAELAAWLAERQVLAREIRVGASSLEALFLRLTGEDAEPAGAADSPGAAE
jgi:ABC-2 type transport system ATP-binding protein